MWNLVKFPLLKALFSSEVLCNASKQLEQNELLSAFPIHTFQILKCSLQGNLNNTKPVDWLSKVAMTWWCSAGDDLVLQTHSPLKHSTPDSALWMFKELQHMGTEQRRSTGRSKPILGFVQNCRRPKNPLRGFYIWHGCAKLFLEQASHKYLWMA